MSQLLNFLKVKYYSVQYLICRISEILSNTFSNISRISKFTFQKDFGQSWHLNVPLYALLTQRVSLTITQSNIDWLELMQFFVRVKVNQNYLFLLASLTSCTSSNWKCVTKHNWIRQTRLFHLLLTLSADFLHSWITRPINTKICCNIRKYICFAGWVYRGFCVRV